MLRFYTIADSKKSLHRLYSVESIEDYKASIQNLNIDIKKMQEVNQVHQDYSFAEKYICEQIEIAERVVFVGVYDVSKEAYFLNKYPNKKFVLCDVSVVAIRALPEEYKNVTVVQATFDDLKTEEGDLIIANISEYFLTKKQFYSLIYSVRGRGGIIFNNVHLYFPSCHTKLYWCIREIRALVINLTSFIRRQRQYQFRGWWRTIEDFMKGSKSTNKYLKSVIFNKKRKSDAPGLYAAMIHFERCD